MKKIRVRAGRTYVKRETVGWDASCNITSSSWPGSTEYQVGYYKSKEKEEETRRKR